MKPTKRPKKGVYARVLVLEVNKQDYHIIYDYQNGTACMASTDCPDGHLRTEYCQERFTKDFGDLAEELAQGKMYMQDWDGSKKEFPHKTEVDEEVIKDAIKLASELRKKYTVDIDLMSRSLGKQFEYANSIGAKKVIIVGKRDLAKKKVTIRDMKTGKEQLINIKEIY